VTEILLAIAMFTGVILLLVAVLMVARRKLVPAGDVSIIINDDPSKAIKVAPGTTLLSALAAEKIFIPSACGGKGSCGVCDVVVKEGGGQILLRPSGTEPKIKYYFELSDTVSAGESIETARARAQQRMQSLVTAFLSLAEERAR